MLISQSFSIFFVWFLQYLAAVSAQGWLDGIGGIVSLLGGIQRNPRGRSPPRTCPRPPNYYPCISKAQANARVGRCCQVIPGMSRGCMQYCNLDLSSAQLIQLFFSGVCVGPDGSDKNLRHFIKCLSGGRDVTPCCRAKGVPYPCDKFCDPEYGMPNLSNRVDQFKCLLTFPKVRNCFWGNMN